MSLTQDGTEVISYGSRCEGHMPVKSFSASNAAFASTKTMCNQSTGRPVGMNISYKNRLVYTEKEELGS